LNTAADRMQTIAFAAEPSAVWVAFRVEDARI
jgi:hypothetical protein